MTLIVLAIAVTVVVVLFAAGHARNAPRRQNRFAASGELGAMPWIDADGGSSDCDDNHQRRRLRRQRWRRWRRLNESSLNAAAFPGTNPYVRR